MSGTEAPRQESAEATRSWQQVGSERQHADGDAPAIIAPARVRATRETRIARHFMAAIADLPELQPSRTRLVFSPRLRRNAMQRALYQAASDLGYEVRHDWDSNDGEPVRLMHERRRDDNGDHVDVYELSVGMVELRRVFVDKGDGSARPVGPLYIHGTDPRGIEADDSLLF
ncbi:MAG: hypothetical protein CSB44_04280 [Gammaproteobacteria bacterium]|nr:MAG: hypothetical protein CSB44_04280 [Gammaproteobacteria bacterium]